MQHIKLLEWDTDFFGYKVGEMFCAQNISNLLAENRLNFRLIYFKVNPNDVLLNEECSRNNGVLVDQKITFIKEGINQNTEIDNSTQLFENEEVSDDLVGLAIQSGAYSRFKIDTNFKNNEFDMLYTHWIENSVNGNLAEKVIVVKEENRIVGLLTLGIKNSNTNIGILAVNTDQRGKGVGKRLVERSFEESLKLGFQNIEVVTQLDNFKACNFYKKMGFVPKQIDNVYHFWL